MKKIIILANVTLVLALASSVMSMEPENNSKCQIETISSNILEKQQEMKKLENSLILHVNKKSEISKELNNFRELTNSRINRGIDNIFELQNCIEINTSMIHSLKSDYDKHFNDFVNGDITLEVFKKFQQLCDTERLRKLNISNNLKIIELEETIDIYKNKYFNFKNISKQNEAENNSNIIKVSESLSILKAEFSNLRDQKTSLEKEMVQAVLNTNTNSSSNLSGDQPFVFVKSDFDDKVLQNLEAERVQAEEKKNKERLDRENLEQERIQREYAYSSSYNREEDSHEQKRNQNNNRRAYRY